MMELEGPPRQATAGGVLPPDALLDLDATQRSEAAERLVAAEAADLAVIEMAEVRGMLRVLDRDLELVASQMCDGCRARLADVPKGWK